MDLFDEKIINEKFRLVRNEEGRLFLKKNILPGSLEIYMRLKTVKNRHIVEIYDIMPALDGGYDVIEEYVDGITLYELAKHRKFSDGEIALYASAVCDGINALHEKGIIHRDLTYNNVMLSRYGEIKIIDFDISRFYNNSGTRDTQILGTPGFAAPEQYGFAQTDNKTDIYALGALMDFMLKNSGGEENAALRAITNKCMKFTPRERFKDVRELENAISHAMRKEKWTYGFFRALKYAYYILLGTIMLCALLFRFCLWSIFYVFESFMVMVLPVMMFCNEFDWQSRFPNFKYADKKIKIAVMSGIYIVVLTGVVLMVGIITAV